jgi:hypothetical protein
MMKQMKLNKQKVKRGRLGRKREGKIIMEPRKVQLGDNEGALALRKNRQNGTRTKHIDVRHHS